MEIIKQALSKCAYEREAQARFYSFLCRRNCVMVLSQYKMRVVVDMLSSVAPILGALRTYILAGIELECFIVALVEIEKVRM
jgi:hypothetical protein